MSADRMNQIIGELKRQAAGEKLAPEQLKSVARNRLILEPWKVAV
jgi:hypothetical protein